MRWHEWTPDDTPGFGLLDASDCVRSGRDETPGPRRWSRGRRANIVVVTLLDRITVNPEVCHGSPTIRGLRYPVSMIMGLLASGMTTDEVLADYADLERDDVLAALEYAAKVTQTRTSVPTSAA